MVGLVHLPCNKDYIACAFTQKNYKLSQMLMSLGHKVIYYGAEGSTVPCTEFVQTHTIREIRDTWGEGYKGSQLGYDWKLKGFKHDITSEPTPLTNRFQFTTAMEILKRKKDDHFLLITQGYYQKPIADIAELYLTCEPGIGYRGSFAKLRAFESSYIQNFTYGSENPFGSPNGRNYDRVIPNYFDPEEFEFSDQKENYFLYLGRLLPRKGIITAYLTARHLGIPLKIAGQGLVSYKGRKLVGLEKGERFEMEDVDYVGCVGLKERKSLLSKARAVFTPTDYLEPFCGVHIEAMLSGTPPIATNFGVFPETIPDFLLGEVGFRCNTLQDFVDAGRDTERMDYHLIRGYAERFLMDNVKWEFEKWFNDLAYLRESAADPKKKGWHRLSY